MATLKSVFNSVMVTTLLAFTSTSHATIFTLTDGNSSLVIDDSILEVEDYEVDTIDHLHEQSFFFRLEGDTKETQISTSDYTLLSSSQTASNTLLVEWELTTGLTMAIEYVLSGGAGGSNTSLLTENISITSDFGNKFALFAYADFDLDDESSDQTASFNGSDAFCQQDDDNLFEACMLTSVAPDFWEISDYSDTRDMLEDSSIDDLSDSGSGLGPIDATFAFQWDRTLLDTETFEVTLTKTINASAVSEPGVASLLLLSLLSVGCARRRAKR